MSYISVPSRSFEVASPPKQSMSPRLEPVQEDASEMGGGDEEDPPKNKKKKNNKKHSPSCPRRFMRWFNEDLNSNERSCLMLASCCCACCVLVPTCPTPCACASPCGHDMCGCCPANSQTAECLATCRTGECLDATKWPCCESCTSCPCAGSKCVVM